MSRSSRADIVVVERDVHVDGAVENQEDKIDDEDLQRYVAHWRHGTFGSSRTRSRRPSFPPSELPLESADHEHSVLITCENWNVNETLCIANEREFSLIFF
jgi:hypothetical protein